MHGLHILRSWRTQDYIVLLLFKSGKGWLSCETPLEYVNGAIRSANSEYHT